MAKKIRKSDIKYLVGRCGQAEHFQMFSVHTAPAYINCPVGIDVEMAVGDIDRGIYQSFSLSPSMARELADLLLRAADEFDAKMAIEKEKDAEDMKALIKVLQEQDRA